MLLLWTEESDAFLVFSRVSTLTRYFVLLETSCNADVRTETIEKKKEEGKVYVKKK